MKFVDQTRISIVAGRGGNGCLSFRREAFVPKGGPDGGGGGKGGDIVLKADPSKHTLLDCQYKQLYRAGKGAHGMGKDRHGRSGDDLIIRVPPGTMVFDDDTGELLADLSTTDEQVIVARGGRGGRGNARFATSRNRAPRRVEPGEEGQERVLRLELKVIADVGLVGMPNSGKSTLISAVSRARPEVADYPFTTKIPHLGVVSLDDARTFVMADIPGLIANAHAGAGMGHRFLRHVERTRILLHLVDPSPLTEPSPVERLDIVTRELAAYDTTLSAKPMLVVITKMDIPEHRAPAEELERAVQARGWRSHAISAVTGQGVRDLMYETARMLKASRETE